MKKSKTIGRGRSVTLAGAAVMAASSLLMVPAPAQAQPMLPRAPQSSVCSFSSGELRVFRSDGQLAVVGTNGTTVSGRGDLFITPDNPTGLDTTSGTATGSLKSYHVSFTVTPKNSSAKGETYEGEVTTTGAITGWIQYTKPQINWTSPDGSVKCTSSTDGGTATVTADVDVYSKPGGNDADKLGFLRAGTQVNLVNGGGCPAEDWCHVTGSNVPNGDGYAWGAFLK